MRINKTQILLYAQDYDYNKNESHKLTVTLNSESKSVRAYIIDDTHCNPKAEWIRLGKPDLFTPSQVKKIKENTALRGEDIPFASENGETTIELNIKTNDVILLEVE